MRQSASPHGYPGWRDGEFGRTSMIRDDLPPPPPSYYRELRKMVEVPVQKVVQIPETRQQVVEDVELRPFPVRRLVEDIEYKVVEEPFTTVVEEPAVRMKQVWVPEHYTRKRTVTSTRQIRVPIPVTREVEEIEERPVPVQRVIDVPGVREEVVEELELVEVTGTQQVDFVPRVGPPTFGPMPSPAELAMHGSYGRGASRAASSRASPRRLIAASWRPESEAGGDVSSRWQSMEQGGGRDDYGGGHGSPPQRTRPTDGGAGSSANGPRVATGTPLGSTLADSDLGVLVLSVTEGGPLAQAGVKAGDVITQADRHVIRTKSELRHVLRQKVHGDAMHLVMKSGSNTIERTITL